MASGGARGDGGGGGEGGGKQGQGLGEDHKDEDEEGKQQRDLITLKRALLGNRMEGVLGIQEQGKASTWMSPGLLQPVPRRAGSSELKGNRNETEDEDESDMSEESILHPGFSNMFGLSELAKTLTPRSSREDPSLFSLPCWNYGWICFWLPSSSPCAQNRPRHTCRNAAREASDLVVEARMKAIDAEARNVFIRLVASRVIWAVSPHDIPGCDDDGEWVFCSSRPRRDLQDKGQLDPSAQGSLSTPNDVIVFMEITRDSLHVIFTEKEGFHISEVIFGVRAAGMRIDFWDVESTV